MVILLMLVFLVHILYVFELIEIKNLNIDILLNYKKMKRDPKNWKYKRTFRLINKIKNFEPAISQLGFLTYGLVVEKDIFLYYDQLFTIYRLLKKKIKKKKFYLK